MIFHPFFDGNMYKNLFSIINLALVTVMVFFSVTLFYQVLSAKIMDIAAPALTDLVALENGASRKQLSMTQQKIDSMDTYQSIITRDLFETREDAKPEKSVSDIELEKLQKTSLKLKLLGTITGRSEDDYAVIEDSQQRKQSLYKKGDAIQQAEIKLILRKKVVLNVNGKDEILVMEDEDKPLQARKGRSFPSAMEEEMEDSMEDPMMEDLEMEPAENINIDRETIDNSLKNINQLMSQVKIRPHFKDGKPNGLLLSHVQQNSIFKDMGLQNGDIVKGVNGREIQSVDDALKFYDSLKSSSSVELQIERGGDVVSINYQIE